MIQSIHAALPCALNPQHPETMKELQLHYAHCHAKALRCGFDGWADTIAKLYREAFNEPMPTASVHALAGSIGGKATGAAKRRSPAHYKRLSALGVAARQGGDK